MKQILIILAVVLVFISGISGCIKSSTNVVTPETTTPEITENVNEELTGGAVVQDAATKTVETRNLLMDKYKYITGGKEERFASAEAFFTQRWGKGYEIKVSTEDKKIGVDVMTDKNCALFDQGKEYEKIASKEGTELTFLNEGVLKEDRTICIKVKAIDEGEIAAHMVANELVFNK